MSTKSLSIGLVNIATTSFAAAAILLDLQDTARVFAVIGMIAILGWLAIAVVSSYIEAKN